MSDLPLERRTFVCWAGAAALCGDASAAPATPAPPEPGPAMTAARPALRTPGRPGDFDFLTGHWTIRNLRKLADGRWDLFDAEASCHGILAGVCSVEELRIPQRHFSGMGLRMLDVKQQLWHDVWVNAAFGVVSGPGIPGSFEGGAGIFDLEEEQDGRRVLHRSVWDRIGPSACRWQQGSSRDGGRNWDVNWHMDWTRRA